jgi:enoyl-[acyl-carrier protein] reductase I
MDFLGIAGRRYIVFGVANKKSVAYAVTEALTEAGAEVVQVVQNDAVRENVARILPNSDIYTCDVEREEEIDQLASDMSKKYDKFHGFVH